MYKFLKNLSFAVLSNAISFVVSALVTLIVPRFISVEGYGYFQLYILYSSYIGLFCLGWIDGIVLRYGGLYYDKLDKQNFHAQFWLFSAIQVVFGIGIMLFAWFAIPDPSRSLIVCMFGIAVIFTLPCSYFRYLLQAVNRIKEYALNVVIERVVYALFILVVLLSGQIRFEYLIVADLIGKLASLAHILWLCRDLFAFKPTSWRASLADGIESIRVGAKLLIANSAGLLITGIVRYAIEWKWSVEVFAKVSLTLSVSNMFMVFIRAVSVVLFPMLKRTDKAKLTPLYSMIRTTLMVPLLAMLLLYYPARLVLTQWLPQYSDGIAYMAMLFPICIFESKTSILIETYMKALRLEKALLFINCGTVALTSILTGLTVSVLQNLDLTVLVIVVALATRCVVAELVIERVLAQKLRRHIAAELLCVAVFIWSSWCVGGIGGVLLYLIAFLLYCVFEKRQILETIQMLKTKGVSH